MVNNYQQFEDSNVLSGTILYSEFELLGKKKEYKK